MKKSTFFIEYNLLIKLLNNNSEIWIKWSEEHEKFKLVQDYLKQLWYWRLKKRKEVIDIMYSIENKMIDKLKNIWKVKKEKIIVNKTNIISNKEVKDNWIETKKVFENQEIKIGKSIVKFHKPIQETKKNTKSLNKIKKNENIKIQLDNEVYTKRKYTNKVSNSNKTSIKNINTIFKHLIQFKKELL